MPSLPCRTSPERNATAISISSGAAARRHAAIASRFASRLPVCPTRLEAATTSVKRIILRPPMAFTSRDSAPYPARSTTRCEMDKGSDSSFNTIVRALALLLLVAACVFPVAHAADPDALSADGGRYYGPIVDGKRHGQGRIEWDTSARYEGGFVRGLYAGKGRLQLASGDVYEGEFVAGMMSGRGSLT